VIEAKNLQGNNRLTKRSKKLNQANIRDKLVVITTQKRHHTCPQHDVDELDGFNLMADPITQGL
jgi:hypothetical protein